MNGAGFVAILMCLVLSFSGLAGTAAIGSLTARGEVRLGAIQAPNGATVFDGQTVATGAGGHAMVALHDTTRVSLGRDAQAKLGLRSVVLERGAARFASVGRQAAIYAAGLRLEATPDSSLDASVQQCGRVNVAVRSGLVRVIDPSGLELASVAPGRAMLFGLAAQEKPQDQEKSQGQAKPQGRSGGQAPGGPGAKPPGGSKAALYVLIGAGAAGAGAGIALSQKRGS